MRYSSKGDLFRYLGFITRKDGEIIDGVTHRIEVGLRLVSEMSVAEMRMLRWMFGKIRRDMIRNETIREMVNVVLIEEKLRQNRLMWFGHIYRRPIDVVVKRVDRLVLGSNATGRERPELTLDVVDCSAQRYECIESN